MNNIQSVINQCQKAAGRYVGDLNLLTLAAFNCGLSEVQSFESYTKEQVEEFTSYLDKFFNTDIPTAYIVGFELFLGNKISVTSDTLIPRFETEELVINLEKRIRSKFAIGSNLDIADVCSGSGVIGVSLYQRLKADYNIKVTFVDISEEALAITELNAKAYELDYTILKGDMLKPLIDNKLQFDVIVSNPPYIAFDEEVQETVVSYEPSLALYAKDNGLALYKSLISDIIDVSKDEFCLMLEIGMSQSEILNRYLIETHGYQFETISDLNGLDRNLYLEV
ncbi:peptide chain release factor N(5)-glutamine methyltransferase [Mollicutes bacterium LVI A0078]|nr:peptide chain release factor N(5)-glutamine methyltransferase [Mollicutes bacterium LVI A0075]WOO91620.1 peptide chain release factor N(5)-glutamine methyltransferase [Mollicutes bacterium LVI A0078]